MVRVICVAACLMAAGVATATDFSKTEVIQYHDDAGNWVLGQVSKVTVDGVVSVDIGYTSMSQPNVIKSFGAVMQTITYNADGTVATIADGKVNTTTASNWYRGIPQTVINADSTSRSAEVDDLGLIRSITDESRLKTRYSYDSMGRLAGTIYPSEPNLTYNALSITFQPVNVAEHGLPAGHWTEVLHRGNQQVTTYFDALWRPVLEQRMDTSDVNGSLSQVATRYDTMGQVVFRSYPTRGVASYLSTLPGIWTVYDPLGRAISESRDSELGPLTSTTQYLSGNRLVVKDSREHQTTTTFQAFDVPSHELPTLVQAPDGITQVITRDVFGSPQSIRQYGSYNNLTSDLTKYLYYDSHHRLVCTSEPESGSTVMAYDAANNVAWTADGQSTCVASQVLAGAKTTRTYDAMNRVEALTTPSNTQNTSYHYDPRGNVDIAVSGVSTWTGHHNNLGLLDHETLQLTGQSPWTLGYSYDANGSLSAISYPDGSSVAYAPDALGRPTRAGSYATGVNYHPNGMVNSFTLGNGALYLANLNERQLLKDFSYAKNANALDLSEAYGYDANANITSVTDLVADTRTKAFTYDELDRLTGATAANLWGSESYKYDPLNNISSRTDNSTGSTITVTYNYKKNLLMSLTDGTTFSYDARGNAQTRNGAALNFDAKNQLINVGGSVTYSYDASGRRVSKTPLGGYPTYYFYSQAGQLMYQWEPGVAKATNFVYLGKRMLARNEIIQLGASGSIGFDANPNNGSYTVSWGAVAGASSYTLQENANGGAWITVYTGATASKAISGKAGGSYQYRVEGCVGSNCGGWTTSATLGVRPALPVVIAPEDIVHGAYTVSWTTPSSTENFDVQERLDGGSWVVLASETTATTVDRPGNAGSYEYRVSAKNSYGTRGWGLSSTVLVGSPPVPNLTTPTDSNTGTYVVSWTAVSGAISYVLQEKVGSGGWSVVQTTDKTDVTITGKANGEYSYQVQACNSAGCSELSVPHTTTVLLPPDAPATINALSVVYTGSIHVTWTASDTATRYLLQEKVNFGSWASVYTGTATSAALTANGTGEHTYQVQACNAGGCSVFTTSATVLVTIIPAGAPALSVPSSSSTGSYTVSWTSVSNAASYDLQQSFNGGTWSTVKRGAVTSVAITGMGSGNYSYRVFACASGYGPSSAIKSIAVTVALPGTPSAPRIDLSGPSYRTIVSLTWDATGGATSYSVEKHAADGTTTVFYEGPNTSFAKLDNSASTSGYRVKACNAVGCSPYGAYGYGGPVKQVPLH